MTLCDAGPLFALVNPRQAELHLRCKEALPKLAAPLVTTWPCFTEAMYLAARAGGWPMQNLLWQYVLNGVLVLHDVGRDDLARMPSLMERYRDTPMDLADASLVVTAQDLGLARIFTLDHHFRVYRLDDSRAFDVVP